MTSTIAPPRIGRVFQEVPPSVREAWDRYQPAHESDPKAIPAGFFFDRRRELKEACAKVGKSGYFILDGYLVGWSPPFGGRRFTIVPAAWSIRKEERPC